MRRVLVLLGTLLLLLTGLSACGEDSGSSSSEKDSGTVTVAGTFGAEPKVTFEGDYQRSTTKATVLTEGKGEAVATGDTVVANLYIANGFNGEQAASTWDEGGATLIGITDSTVPGIRDAIVGQSVGSRVQVEAAPKDAFGDGGNEGIAIAPGDPVVFVVDIVSKLADPISSKASDQKPGQPKIVQKDDQVTGFDFTGTAKKAPTTTQAFTIIQGDGPKITKNSKLAVRYLGQVWGGKKPFDENYSKDLQPLALADTVAGWRKMLPGMRIGSRVLLYVPPADGYGAKGKGKDIKGTDTMVFVIDILGVV
ncbi:FKBP-type peptidyl-prolyl cis-trans isomerase [Nocardioides jensenii]|uniref:FKBP-type peptidyl-prolyl cis-trans isomerase n=1 Tax=Nocardioides jensenii TaxID=1843 RepID=UPI000836C202|nr:FKBP-type peptidyl-prolyl cis-trans isomerase [Nocardioides jensenii]